MASAEAKTLTYEQLLAELKKPGALLIDVRGQEERNNEGKIPGSKNVPIDEIETAFKLAAAEFKAKYGFDKPSTKYIVICHCKAGIRAANGVSILQALGYNNAESYPGLIDWTQHGGALEK